MCDKLTYISVTRSRIAFSETSLRLKSGAWRAWIRAPADPAAPGNLLQVCDNNAVPKP